MNTLRQLQETWVYDIINVLATALKPKDSIHALWLEGSYAQGVHDDMSDIDIWVSVDDDKMTEALDVIRTELKNIGELDIDYEMPHLHPKIRHQVFHIKGHSKFHAMDVNVQCLSRIVFLQESVDDYITIFDKSGIIKSKQDDPEKDSQLVDAELAMQYYKLQASNIKKNIIRGKKLEALIYYNYLVNFVIELERRKVTPQKAEYGLKHIYKDLNPEFVSFIEDLASTDVTVMSDNLAKIESYIKQY